MGLFRGWVQNKQVNNGDTWGDYMASKCPSGSFCTFVRPKRLIVLS